MNYKKNIIELAEQFKRMESTSHLFNLKTEDGIYYWDIIRYTAYMMILSKNGIYENVDIYLKKSGNGKFKNVIKVLKLIPQFLLNEFRFHFSPHKSRKYCFLLVSRFEDLKGNPTDLLLKDIYEQLKENSFVMEYFRHQSFSRRRNNINERYFLYRLEISNLIGRSPKDNWDFIAQIINSEFNLDIKWEPYFQRKMEEYRKSHRFFKRLFKKIQPKYLFFQSEPKGMTAAANELGIITVDLQHGHTNNVDMFYSYPKKIDLGHVMSIPKVFLTLGNFWNNIIDFPNLLITCGNSYFNIQTDLNADEKRGVLVVSTLFIHDFLKEQIIALAEHNIGITFYYKLHSNQAHQLKDTKLFFKNHKNIIVVYTEQSVKELMNECFAIAVIQSSVAYQALQKGLKVFIFKQDYYEASYDIFDQSGVLLVNNWEEISSRLKYKHNEINNIKAPVFFEPYQSSVIDAIVAQRITD